MRSPLLIVSLLLVATAALWLVWPAPERAVEAASPRAESASPSAAPEARAEVGARNRLETAGALRTAWGSASPAGPTFVPLGADAAESAGSIEVRVLRARERAPVPFARVQWFERPGASREELVAAFHGAGGVQGAESGLLPESIWLEADLEGRFRAPRPASSAVAFASAERVWGYAFLDGASAGPREVLLHGDFDVLVRVVEASGAPRPAARVDLSVQHEGPWSLAHAVTDGRGEATLRHCGWLLDQRGMALGPHVVALSAALAPPVEVELDASNPPQGALQLVAPPSGSLAVRVVDPRGLAAGAVESVTLSVHRARSQELEGGELVDFLEQRSIARPVLDGVALFECVGLDLEFRAEARLAGSSTTCVARGHGPLEPGQRASMELLVGASGKLVTGRVLDESGAPLAHRALAVWFVRGEDKQHVHSSLHPTSDDQGRFVGELDVRRVAPLDASVVVEAVDSSWRPTAAGRFRLRGGRDGGVLELGDLVLQSLPPFVRGWVVDAAGAPLEGAEVALLGRRADAGWEALRGIGARSDALGRFELRHVVELASYHELALDARRGAASSATTPVREGESEIVLRVALSGAIAGRLALHPSVPFDALTIVASETPVVQGTARETWSAESVLASDGSFELRGLREGVHDVHVLLGEGEPSIALVAGVEVCSGMLTNDPRLAAWNIADRLRCVELAFVDRDGRAVAAVPHFFAGGELLRAAPRPGGRWRVLTDGGRFDAWVEAPGCAARLLREVDSNQRVELAAAPCSRFALGGAPQLPPGCVLRARVWPLEPGARGQELARWIDFDAQGVATSPPGWFGATGVELVLVRTSEGGERAEAVVTLDADSPADGGCEPVLLPMALPALERALAR